MNDAKDEQFISICQPKDAVQAGMIREALEQAGVNCYVSNENFSAIRTFGGVGAGTMAVMVPESQAEQATQIIKDLGVN